MISKRKLALGAVLLILFSSIVTGVLTIKVSEYLNVKKGDRVIISREDYNRLTEAQKIYEVKDLIKNRYLGDSDDQMIMDWAIKGMVASLGDRYSAYLTPEENAELQIKLSGTYGGVGLLVTIDPEDMLITVIKPFKDSPSMKAGILPGDKLVEIDGKKVNYENYDMAVSMLRGEKGTQVAITIYREGEDDLLEFTLTRDIIVQDTIEHRMLDNGIGYISFSFFDQNTAEEFANGLNALMEKYELKGLVVDVRSNPGGYLHICTQIADLLLPEALIVYTEDKEGNRDEKWSDENSIGLPIVVLVNGMSASASEVLAGAIQDNSAGFVIGTQTHGKGSVQSIINFKDGSTLKLTTENYYTPKGRNINGVGIKPDVEVELPEELAKKLDIEDEEDTQLQKAIEMLEKVIS